MLTHRSCRELATTPILIVANKIDIEPHVSEKELIRGASDARRNACAPRTGDAREPPPPCAALNLDYIMDNPWIVIPASALRQLNVDQIIQWLVKEGEKK